MTPLDLLVIVLLANGILLLAAGYREVKRRRNIGDCGNHHFGDPAPRGKYNAEVRKVSRDLISGEVRCEVNLWEEVKTFCQHEGCIEAKDDEQYVDTKDITFDL